ncbi:alkyl sulfatase dimerization domain-containing protein [Paraburkholderia nemoris]|uniref:alkyl sulfatase dimerization domain-containing protein n=1 Tax=Paraburkholderia nemoris TaxID=2793076 RepID=UPI0038BDB35F
MNARDILLTKETLVRHADGVYTLGGQGNSLVVDLGDTLLLVDAGPGDEITEAMIQELRGSLVKPVAYLVYSHGHMGYNNGVCYWQDDAARRGHPAPILIAQENVPARYRRYRETAGLQAYTNVRQFRSGYPADPPAHWFQMPTLTYRERLVVHGSEREVILMHVPSETDDGTAVWIPDVHTLFAANAFIKTCPNAGSPYRIFRDPMRWAQTLDRLAELRPQVLIPQFGKPVTDCADIHEALSVPARAMRYLRDEVLRRMNQGMEENDIIHDVPLPDELFGSKFMKPAYGCAEYLMHDIWRSENGWWNRNPTDLHPAPPAQVAAAVRRALAHPEKVLARARELQAAGEIQLALHVIDLLTEGDARDTLASEARVLKAQLCKERAGTVTAAVSHNLYLSAADELLGLPAGADDLARVDSYEWK